MGGALVCRWSSSSRRAAGAGVGRVELPATLLQQGALGRHGPHHIQHVAASNTIAATTATAAVGLELLLLELLDGGPAGAGDGRRTVRGLRDGRRGADARRRTG